jgi:hypothetical protein
MRVVVSFHHVLVVTKDLKQMEMALRLHFIFVGLTRNMLFTLRILSVPMMMVPSSAERVGMMRVIQIMSLVGLRQIQVGDVVVAT